MSYIFLYSEYSKWSIKFLNIIEENNLIDSLNIHLICIDNKEIRNSILHSKKISIKYIPVLLEVKNNNEVDIYEKQNLYDFLQRAIQQVSKPATNQNQTHIQTPFKNNQNQLHVQTIPEQNQKQINIMPEQNQTQIHATSNQNDNLTNISNVLEEPLKKPIAIRNGPGNYSLTELQEIPVREFPEKVDDSIKKESIYEKAMLMRKQRDTTPLSDK
jgi:hypothetical protein